MASDEPEPPLRKGPVMRTGRLFEQAFEWRMDLAAERCLKPGTDDHFVLTVSLGEKGNIEAVETEDPGSSLAFCAESVLFGGAKPFGWGPGRMQIAYYLDRDGGRTAWTDGDR